MMSEDHSGPIPLLSSYSIENDKNYGLTTHTTSENNRYSLISKVSLSLNLFLFCSFSMDSFYANKFS